MSELQNFLIVTNLSRENKVFYYYPSNINESLLVESNKLCDEFIILKTPGNISTKNFNYYYYPFFSNSKNQILDDDLEHTNNNDCLFFFITIPKLTNIPNNDILYFEKDLYKYMSEKNNNICDINDEDKEYINHLFDTYIINKPINKDSKLCINNSELDDISNENKNTEEDIFLNNKSQQLLAEKINESVDNKEFIKRLSIHDIRKYIYDWTKFKRYILIGLSILLFVSIGLFLTYIIISILKKDYINNSQ